MLLQNKNNVVAWIRLTA